VVEVSDSILAALGVGITALLGLFYFMSNKKDRSKFDTASNVRSDEEAERDKQELARKVKKELQDEAEKVEKIRKDVAVDVKEETNAVTDQKIREQHQEFTHQLEMHVAQETAKFQATDKVMSDLMSKMVEVAKNQSDAIVKINESIEALRQLLYETRGKVQNVEREQDKRSTNR
jgi:hypothetical protein